MDCMVADHRSESCLRAKYWDEGKSQTVIAKELDVSVSTVSCWMKKHGIETRSISEVGLTETLKNSKIRND
jgi:transposase